MSPEFEKRSSVVVSWHGSKEVLAMAVRRVYDHLSETGHRDLSADVGGFVYDLGHSGRGMEKFPSKFQLTGNTGTDTMEIPVPDLIRQIISAVSETFPTSGKDAITENLGHLKKMADLSEGLKFQLQLQPRQEGQKITAVKLLKSKGK